MNELTEFPERYYRPSGAVPVFGTLSMLFGGMATAVLLGFLCALINYWLPSIWVRLALTVGYGAAVGAAVRFSARIAHVRHPGFTRFVALAVGLFAVYMAWVWFLWVIIPLPGANIGQHAQLVWGWFTHPGAIIQVMQVWAANGLWSIFDFMPKGFVLYAIWAVEALAFIGFTVAISVNPALTYCEACRRWTDRNEQVAHLPLTDVAALRTELEGERYEILDELRAQGYDWGERLDIGTSTCPTCAETTFLTVSHVKVGTDGNGHPTENANAVIQHLIVPRELADRLAIPVIPDPAAETQEPDEAAGDVEPAPA